MSVKTPLLSSEEDFNTILVALDVLCSHQENQVVIEATTKAYLSAAEGKAGETEPSEADIKKAVNLNEVFIARSKIRDKFIILKARVVEMKQILQLKSEIDQITE